MQLARRRGLPPEVELVEVVTPRTNAAAIGAAENLFAALALAEPFSLEIAATRNRRRFLARTRSPAARRSLEDQLGVAYPQASLRRLDPADPAADPARLVEGEQAAACVLRLRGPVYLPLRTFLDREVAGPDDAPSAQADPVLGLLGALGDLPEGWRSLSQLVVRPAPDDWCAGYLRFAQEHPLERERAEARHDTSLGQVYALAALLVVGLLGFQAYEWYLDEDWLRLGLLGAGALLGAAGLVWLALRLGRRTVHDPRLVREKVARIAFQAQLRLTVVAPAGVPAPSLAARLGQVAAAYRQFGLAAGNGFVARPLRPGGGDLREATALPSWRASDVLNTRELAGLWHLPQQGADAPFVERTAARQRLPLPETVARGCRIGVSSHQGRTVTVHLPDELLARHLLLVAKTRRGKSSVLLRIARHAMERSEAGGTRPGLLLVDPHRDLAQAVLGLVPPDRRDDVVYLDAAERERPFGLNLLDVGLGWERDQAVESTLRVFERMFDSSWGRRMENAFRWSLATLYEANRALCASHPNGRVRQHTILDVPAVLNSPAFRRVLRGVTEDPWIGQWWSEYDQLGRPMQIETANPVLTKIYRFAASRAARSIVGQPRSTVDPGAWVREGKLVIVNTAKGTIGEDTAALIGGTLVNLVGLVVARQAALPPAERRPVTMIVDEFQSTPGADYELVLSELAKYRANLVLATQSLARLDALDKHHERALRPTVFANVDGLLAFNVSAEDARQLARELAGEVDEADLLNLPDYACYARITAGGRRLPVFSVQLDEPPEPNDRLRADLADASAKTYGRDWRAVEADVQGAIARVELARRQAVESAKAGQAGAGVARDARAAGSDRSEHRNEPATRRAREQAARAALRAGQLRLLEGGASAAAEESTARAGGDAEEDDGREREE
jgi:hypothetical protein